MEQGCSVRERRRRVVETKMLVTGLGNVKAMLGRAARKYERFPNIRIGFDASYALYVNYNLEAKWKGKPRKPSPPHRGVYWGPAGEPLFMDKTISALKGKGVIAKIITQQMRSGQSLKQSSLAAALFVLKEMQLRCPVDSGHLQSSGFVKQGESIYRNPEFPHVPPPTR